MNSTPSSLGAKSLSVSNTKSTSSPPVAVPSPSFESSVRRSAASNPSVAIAAPRKGQASRKQHRDKRRPVRDSRFDDDYDMDQIRAIRNATDRRGQTSITHLLNNYRVPTRQYLNQVQGYGHGNSRPARRHPTWGPGSGYHPIDKANFVHANYRFVVSPNGDYSAQAHDADKHLDWNDVLQIIASSESQSTSCPICLSDPIAPRMARCGHVFCLSCLIRFMHSTDDDEPAARKETRWKKCPICEDHFRMADTRPVRFYAGQESPLPRPGDDVVLRLMFRDHGSTIALPKEGGVDVVNLGEEIPWHFAANVMDYSRIMKGTDDYMLAQYDREIQDLRKQAVDDEIQFGRNGVYQQALTQALPPSTGNKRSASARSPSPTGHPNKSRRTDIPTGPRAMLREGPSTNNSSGNSRSLLDRMSGPPPRRKDSGPHQADDIQSRIDNITQNSPEAMAAMMNGGFPGMDMSAMAGMANPMMLQEMMMNQMALMAQMANSMGMLNGGAFAGPGFPQPGMPGDVGMYPPGQHGQGVGNAGRGRGSSRGSRGNLRGRGGSNTSASSRPESLSQDSVITEQTAIAAPVPVTPTAAAAQQIPYALPERPQSPTLCKFGLKCTNAQCRYAHPSPVATPESGVVLSNEPCEKGKDCQDKDCVKGHVSPAVLKPQAQAVQPTPQPAPSSQATVACRFGNACTRPNCPFAHPTRPASGQHYAQQCRFGASCTKATCPFQHPEGRVLPGTFHRGLATTGTLVNVPTPETGSMGAAASHHRSMKFVNNNKPAGSSGLSVKEQMQQQLAEMEARKKAAEQALKDAQAAAASKKDESSSTPIPA